VANKKRISEGPSSPLLLDLTLAGQPGPTRPTTRDIANAVKLGGSAALTSADERADHARYQEVTARSALNRVEGMPFRWTLNPYRGCTHGCHYCFARRYHTQFELNVDDEFTSVILVKHNIAAVLGEELRRPSWHKELVAVGTATDPYQPIEGQYKLTRGCLERFVEGRTPVGLVTKGPMVVRDRDVLLALARAAGCTVHMSVPTIDEDAWQALEPGTAHPLQRLRAVRQLVDAGINAGVLMAPIVPGFSSSLSKVERTVKAIADHGARFVGYNVMHLQEGTRTHFMAFLRQQFPNLLPRYERLYARKHPPNPYREQVRSMVQVLERRYGLSRERTEPRPERDAAQGEHEGAEQAAFAW
jgi:DNA repair photolyase